MNDMNDQTKWRVNTTTIILVLLNFFMLIQLQAIAEAAGEKELNHFKFPWDIATDNPAVYELIPMLDLQSLIKELPEAESNIKDNSQEQRRRKRSYPSNYGKLIYKRCSSTQHMPCAATVRISGERAAHCSGSLISERHVLTAAHCVHDGKRLRYKLPSLKVGFLRRNGKFHWIRVTKILVPDAWKRPKGRKRFTADFAVLRLKRRHGRSHFVPQSTSYYSKSPVMFSGFPSDKGGQTIWTSSCRVEKVWGNYHLSRCVASQGSSGSGVYMSRVRGGYAVTGVVSARMRLRNDKLQVSFTVTTNLKASYVKLICHWLGRKAC